MPDAATLPDPVPTTKTVNVGCGKVTRPIAGLRSVNHRLPSGPVEIPSGKLPALKPTAGRSA